MTRICAVLLILAISVAASAQEPSSRLAFQPSDKVEGVALAFEESSGTQTGKSLEFSAKTLALWQEDPQPAQPHAALALPAKPAVEIGPVPVDPVPLLPRGTTPPNSLTVISPQGAASQPALLPKPDANSPAASTEAKPGPAADNDASVPFNILEPNRETEITVTQGRSRLLRSQVNFSRTAVVDPAICDLIQYSPSELGFVGKSVGTTQVTVWFRDSDDSNIDTQPRSFIVHVVPDLSTKEPRLKQLEAEIAKLFPNSKIRLRTFGQRILVLGQARDVSEAAEILNIIRGEQIDSSGRWLSGPNAGASAGTGAGGGQSPLGASQPTGSNNANSPLGSANLGGRGQRNFNRNDLSDIVVNMIKVPGVHQVMLRVKIAELDRTAARSFGANFSANVQFRNGTLLLQSLLNASNANSIIGNFNSNQLSFGIHYLEQHGVVRLLSEPTLVTLSGQPATMVAGGEFAVPTVVGISGAEAATTDFRAYGAIVSFTPFLLDKDLFRLQVSPEFSQIDTSTTVNGVPGLTTRTVTTTVELRAGQTLAIAGLLDESMKSDTEFDWPWIGKLLGPRNVSRSETELIVLVTPELVHPMEPEEVPPLPGFDVTEPSNIEFFLRGDIEGNPTRDYRSTVWPRLQQRYRAGGSPMISGPFGHSNEWAGDPSNSPK